MATYITPSIKRLQDQAIGFGNQDPYSNIDLSGIDPKYMQSDVPMDKEQPKGFMENVKTILGNNPQIAQYLLGMGAGMAQGSVGQSFGGALAQGFGTAGQFAAQDVERQNTAADEMKRFKQQQAMILASHKALKQEDVNAETRANVSKAIGYQNYLQTLPPEVLSKLPGADKVISLDPSTNYEAINQFGESAIKESIKAPKTPELTFNPVTGEGYLRGESGIAPFNGPTSTAAPNVTQPTTPMAKPPAPQADKSGNVNIFQPQANAVAPSTTSANLSPKTMQKEQELSVEAQQKQATADRELLQSLPDAQAKFDSMAQTHNNLYGALNKYDTETSSPLRRNDIAFNAYKHAEGTPEAGLNSLFEGEVLDKLKALKQDTGSAAQIANSLPERAALTTAVTGGGGPIERKAAHRLAVDAARRNAIAQNENMKNAYLRVHGTLEGFREPFDVSKLPSYSKVIDVPDGKFSPGQTLTGKNGKKYRAISSTQLEEM